MSAHPEAWALDWALSNARSTANAIRNDESADPSFDRGYVLGASNIATGVCYGDEIALRAVENEVRFLMHNYSRRSA